MVKLSATVITFNEERNIRRCIESLLPIADEIFIVDSFSKDRTKEIAAEYPVVRFIENPFEGHIQQKNFALCHAKYDWVISLDADEALTPELTASIKKVMLNPEREGYRFNRFTYYCGHWVRHSGWYPDTKLRLVKKSNAEWRGTNPHDKLELIDGSDSGFLEGDLLHYSYYAPEEHFRQIEYFGTIAASEMFRKGKKVGYPLMYLKVAAHFIKAYFFKLGFLDGKTGWLVCTRSAYGTYVKYKKLMSLNKQTGR